MDHCLLLAQHFFQILYQCPIAEEFHPQLPVNLIVDIPYSHCSYFSKSLWKKGCEGKEFMPHLSYKISVLPGSTKTNQNLKSPLFTKFSTVLLFWHSLGL